MQTIGRISACALATALIVFSGECVARALNPNTQSKETVLFTFTGGNEGSEPYGLVMDASGNLYGTTFYGGTYGDGTAYRLAPDGNQTVLYSFSGKKDGERPTTAPIIDGRGNLYSTTAYGGSHGDGVIFKITSEGTEKSLYEFCSQQYCADGANPNGPLVMDKRGNLYGTAGGGPNLCYPINSFQEPCGVVFRLSNGTETVLHSFVDRGDGYLPESGLIMDAKGHLYGTTSQGGAHGYGTVFKLSPNGTESILYSFAGGKDGAIPTGQVMMDATGNLFGTTQNGGNNQCSYGLAMGCGTVYELSPNGKETVLHRFTGKNDGGYPQVGLVENAQGNLYGAAQQGGSWGQGTVFEILPDGTFAVIYTFTDGNDGGSPNSTPIESNGYLYGTTYEGGTTNGGVVFKIKE